MFDCACRQYHGWRGVTLSAVLNALSTHFQCEALRPQTSQTRGDSQLVQQKAGEIGNVMGDAALLNVVNYVRIIFFFFFSLNISL